MFKLITNIFFIIMLFIFLSGMPLNLEIVDINPFQPVIETPVETVESIQYTLSDHMIIDLNTNTLTFEVLASSNSQPSEDFLKSISIRVTNASEESTYMLTDLYFSLSNSDNSLATSVSVSLDALTSISSGGYYEITVDSDNTNNMNTIQSSFNKLVSDEMYLGSSDLEVNGDYTTRVYYPTSDYKYLIPVSLRMTYPENRTRATFVALYEEGPAALALYPSPTVPYAPRIYIRGGVASVYMYAYDYRAFESNFKLASEAVINTLTNMELIDTVKFYLDDQDQTPFGGVDLTQSYGTTLGDALYLAYDNDSEYLLLAPVSMTQYSDAISSDYQSIFESLKGKGISTTLTSDGFSPTVPYGIELKDGVLNEGTLTLVLSADAITAFDGLTPDFTSNSSQMMVDSLTYTYTSIQGIDQVRIEIESGESTLYGIDLSQAFSPKPYINLYENQ